MLDTIDGLWRALSSGRDAVLLEGAVVLALAFALLWLVELRSEDATLVDVGWAAGLGALAIGYAIRSPGLPERRLFLALFVGAWSFRLAAHIFLRHRGRGEDPRYRELRGRWGPRAHVLFFLFYEAQAMLAVLLSIPFLLVAFDSSTELHPVSVLGWGLVVVGIAGETVADRQLERHRADPANRGRTCRSGLWRYSRHPNYFFEWVTWCGFAAAALPAPYGPLGLASPLLMLFLLVKVTGIPPSEERALKSRGRSYRRYQETTSAFVPWFPKKASS